MPPIVLTIISIIKLAIKYAPEAVEVYKAARDLISMWFSGGLITIEQQAALMKWADDHEAATLAGIKPPELEIEPDPQPNPAAPRQNPPDVALLRTVVKHQTPNTKQQ